MEIIAQETNMAGSYNGNVAYKIHLNSLVVSDTDRSQTVIAFAFVQGSYKL